jgi:hypothetical protein
MKQQTLAMAADAESGFEHYRKPTRRDEFLKTMQAIVPWAALCEVIEPHYREQNLKGVATAFGSKPVRPDLNLADRNVSVLDGGNCVDHLSAALPAKGCLESPAGVSLRVAQFASGKLAFAATHFVPNPVNRAGRLSGGSAAEAVHGLDPLIERYDVGKRSIRLFARRHRIQLEVTR